MKLDLVVVTNCVRLRDTVGRKKESLLDREFLQRLREKGVAPVVSSFFDQNIDVDGLAEFILERYSEARACILVVDSRLSHISSYFSPAVLTVGLDLSGPQQNYPNALRKSLTLALKVLDRLNPFFSQRDKLRLALLPRKNFSASEWREFLESTSGGVSDLRMVSDFEGTLARLRQRQKPKTSSKYRNTYVVSDNGWYFFLGHEDHAKAETSCPPHLRCCVLAARYRLGFPISPAQHYNVSEEGNKISGSLTNCHGEENWEDCQTHINVFPNDYYEK